MEQLIKDIEAMRIALNMSKRELAIKAEISEEYYWRIVTGKAPGVAFLIIEKLCNCLGIYIIHYIKPELFINENKKPDNSKNS